MSPDYTFGTASLEIVLLALLAFGLGTLTCHLLRKIGICCGNTDVDYSVKNHVSDREFPNTGGYTADINSLLRDPNADKRTVTPPSVGITTDNISPKVTVTASTGRLQTDTTAELNTLKTSSVSTPLTGLQKDDLKKLEGVGPRIEQLLNAAGIYTFSQLADLTPELIKPILDAAGKQFQMHDPKSWPYQAELAANGEWQRLKEYQDLLISGKSA